MVENKENRSQSVCTVLVAGIQQEAGERVKAAVVVTDNTSHRHDDGHLVPRLQRHGHNSGGAVFAVLLVPLQERRHLPSVHSQTGAGGPAAAAGRQVGVEGEGDAVDARTGGGEDPGLDVVAVSQVDEDVFVDDDGVIGEGAIAGQSVVQSDGEDATAAWKHMRRQVRGGKNPQKNSGMCHLSCCSGSSLFCSAPASVLPG